MLGDQLSETISSLDGADPARDVVLMCEVMEEATYVRHHQKKIAFLFAAMRHFAEGLRGRGFAVRYVRLDDPANSGSLEGEVAQAIAETGAGSVVVTEPGEYRLRQAFEAWPARLGVPVEMRADDRFLCSIARFRQWGYGRKLPRMEYFYREMRREHGLLIEPDGTPTGGKWNYDKQNRKPPPRGLYSPKRISHAKSAITREVLRLVKERFGDHFGTLEPFHFAVTRDEALQELDHFTLKLLPHFGDHQDAMKTGEAYLFHSLLSCYLNAGLLLPLEICRKAEQAYRDGHAPLNAVEGFIRQILGWREFVRGIYWLYMPEYAGKNYLGATRPLPWFYWSAETSMFCVAEAVRHTRDHAYSHHIQRLMVTGNFALLAGLNPAEVCEWYLIVYADAYEWVELPNTLGMALYGDGGIIGSKPYAASGKYIDRMSDFCRHCRYDPNVMVGEAACPFNALYWDFLARHEKALRGNPRMPYAYASWDRMTAEKRHAIRRQAAGTLTRMEAGEL